MVKPFLYGKPRSRGGRRAAIRYLLLESGEKIRLENLDGYLLLEHQDVRNIANWNMRRDGRL